MANVARDAKRRRVANVLHVGGVTMRGLQQIVAGLRGEKIGKRTIESVNNEIFNKLKLTSTVEMLDSEPFDLVYADPCRLLQEMVHSSAELQEVYAQAANAHPCTLQTPWSLVFGCDEFTIGDQFK